MRSLFWPTAVALSGIAVLIGLGTWQLQRLDWKTQLIAAVEERVAAEPEPLPPPATWAELDLDGIEYRRFTAAGVFQHDREIHLFTHLSEPRGRHGGAGYLVVTPLVLDGGGTVLVNRGFVPKEFKDPSTRPQGQVPGRVTVTGLLRKPEVPGGFVPENDRDGNIWFYRDIASMARASGHPDAAPFLLDESANTVPGGLPQAGETRLVFKNDHLQYALTWYALALCLAGVYTALWIGQRRRRSATPDGSR